MSMTLCTLNKCSLPISQLQPVEQLSASDLFILERVEGKECADEDLVAESIVDSVLLELETAPEQVGGNARTQLVGDVLEYVHSNGKMTYSDLSSRMLYDLSAMFNFNTMSTRDTWEYSKTGHSHREQYSDTRVFPLFPKRDYDSQLWLGNFIVWQLSSGAYTSSEISVYSPRIEFPAYTLPDIGEVRFMGWLSAPTSTSEASPVHISVYQQYDPLSESDVTLVATPKTPGWWTYCNGATVKCGADEFQDACTHFAGNPRATEFTLPNLNNFVVLNPGTEQSAPMQRVEHENGLSAHTHTIEQPDRNFSIEFKGQLVIKTMMPGGNGRFVHSGNGTPIGTRLSKLSCYFDDQGAPKLEGKKITSSAGSVDLVGDDAETKPKSNKLLALVYLGEF